MLKEYFDACESFIQRLSVMKRFVAPQAMFNVNWIPKLIMVNTVENLVFCWFIKIISMANLHLIFIFTSYFQMTLDNADPSTTTPFWDFAVNAPLTADIISQHIRADDYEVHFLQSILLGRRIFTASTREKKKTGRNVDEL